MRSYPVSSSALDCANDAILGPQRLDCVLTPIYSFAAGETVTLRINAEDQYGNVMPEVTALVSIEADSVGPTIKQRTDLGSRQTGFINILQRLIIFVISQAISAKRELFRLTSSELARQRSPSRRTIRQSRWVLSDSGQNVLRWERKSPR